MGNFVQDFSPVTKKNVVSEKYLILFYLFLVLPFFDMVNGFLVVRGLLTEGGIASPSQLGRLVATLILLLVCFFKKLNSAWIFMLLYLIGLEMFYGLQHQQIYGVVYGVISSYKLIYLFLATVSLKYYLKTEEDYYLLGKFIKWNLYLIACSLLFSLVTGLGNSTYGYGFGTKGFFASGNGIGIYMGVMTLVMFAFKKYAIYDNVSVVALVTFAFCTGVIGSKTAMLLSLICFMCLMWFSRYRTLWVSFAVLLGLMALPMLFDTFRVVFDVVVKRYEASDSLILFLGSGRIGYVENAVQVFLAQSDIILRLLFGSGAFLSFQNPDYVRIYDTLETDLFDVLFMYGLVGVTIFLTLFSYIGYCLRKYFIFILAFTVLFFHSIVAGHVLFNGMSSFPIVVLFLVSSFLKTRARDAQ
jgi:hypothetical protein